MTLLTLEQFERLPDDDMRHELDDGELISAPPPLGRHGKISAEIGFLLKGFVDPLSLGDVFVESGFRLNPDTPFARRACLSSAPNASGQWIWTSGLKAAPTWPLK